MHNYVNIEINKKSNYEKIMNIKSCLENVLNQDDIEFYINLKISEIYSNTLDFSNAEIYIKKAMEYNNKNYLAKFRLSKLYMKIGKYDKAEKEIKEYIKNKGENINAILLLSKIYFCKGEKRNAKKILENAIKTNPKNIFLLAELINIYLEENKFHKAKVLVNRSLNIKSDSLKSNISKAKLLIYDGKYDEAEEILVKYDKINNTDLFMELGKLYYKEELYKKAICQFQKCLEINPDSFYARLELVKAYYVNNNAKKFIKNLRECLSINNLFILDKENVIFNIGKLLYLRKKYKEALSIFEKLITKNNPKNYLYYLEQIKCIVSKKNLFNKNLFSNIFKKAKKINLNATNFELKIYEKELVSLANKYYLNNVNILMAENLFNKAYRIKNNSIYLKTKLAKIALLKGDFYKAKVLIDESYSLNKNNLYRDFEDSNLKYILFNYKLKQKTVNKYIKLAKENLIKKRIIFKKNIYINNLEEADKIMQESLLEAPDNIDLFLDSIILYIKENKFTLVKEILEKFIEENKELKLFKLILAKVNIILGDYDAAEKIFIEDLKLIDHNIFILIALAKLWIDTNQNDKLESIIEEIKETPRKILEFALKIIIKDEERDSYEVLFNLLNETREVIYSNTLNHLLSHSSNNENKNIHGIFDCNIENLMEYVSKKINIKEKKKNKYNYSYNYEIYYEKCGYEGGKNGDGHKLNYIKLIVNPYNLEVITMYPADKGML